MQLSLINQILAENDYVQQLRTSQDPKLLFASYQRLKKLVQQLNRFDPTKKSYCLAFTILSTCLEMSLEQMQQQYYRADYDWLARTTYTSAFERLQYQTNLSVSMLS